VDIFNLCIFQSVQLVAIISRFSFFYVNFLFSVIVFLVFRCAVVVRRIPLLVVKLTCFQVLVSYIFAFCQFQFAVVVSRQKFVMEVYPRRIVS